MEIFTQSAWKLFFVCRLFHRWLFEKSVLNCSFAVFTSNLCTSSSTSVFSGSSIELKTTGDPLRYDAHLCVCDCFDMLQVLDGVVAALCREKKTQRDRDSSWVVACVDQQVAASHNNNNNTCSPPGEPEAVWRLMLFLTRTGVTIHPPEWLRDKKNILCELLALVFHTHLPLLLLASLSLPPPLSLFLPLSRPLSLDNGFLFFLPVFFLLKRANRRLCPGW